MTQIYQHEEDLSRGDRTLSAILGIRGTFHFTAVAFTIAVLAFSWYFSTGFGVSYAGMFILAMFPVVAYFGYWYLIVRKDVSKADFSHTMRLNWISAIMLNLFFIYFFLEYSQVLQAINAGY